MPQHPKNASSLLIMSRLASQFCGACAGEDQSQDPLKTTRQ